MSKGSAGESSLATRSSGSGNGRTKTASKKASDSAALDALQAHFAGAFDVAQPIKPVSAASSGRKRPRSAKDAESIVKRLGTAKEERKVDPQGRSTKSRSTAMEPPLLSYSTVEKSGKSSVVAARPAPQTVVFGGESASSTSERAPGWRKFMSSKVAKPSDGTDLGSMDAKGKKRSQSGDEANDADEALDADDEVKNLTNDRALSELLSTTLFAPGAQETRRANGQRKLGSNETMARLLELSKPTLTKHATSVGRGLGSATLKAQQMNKMPATMRHGMRDAERYHAAREVERQKELGNYHSSIKGLVGGRREGMDLVLGQSSKNKEKRTRQRGLGMGVGSFKNGALRISGADVARINESKGPSQKKRKK